MAGQTIRIRLKAFDHRVLDGVGLVLGFGELES